MTQHSHGIISDCIIWYYGSRKRRALIALVFASLPWYVLAMALLIPATAPVIAFVLPFSYLALVLGVCALFIWVLIRLMSLLGAERKRD